MFTVSADPIVAFVDAFKAPIATDPTLLAGGSGWRALTGIYGHLSEASRVDEPYLVLGRRSATGDAGAMQIAGSMVSLQLDGWSDNKGPYEIEMIGSRVFALMERRAGFSVPGFEYVRGSLHREFVEIFDEPDADKPGATLYHLVQRWTAEIHEAQ